MPLETATYVADLNASNPLQTEGLNTADDHLRLIKSTILATFPNMEGEVTVDHLRLNRGALPQGCIVMWSGSVGSIPTGWALCDGTAGIDKEDGSGTFTAPDLRGKFIIGAGGDYAVGDNGGSATAGATTSASNGAHTHTVTVATDGSHTHGGVTGSHVLTEAEIPNHGHPWRHSTATSGAPDGTGGIGLFATGATNKSAFTGTPASTVGQTRGGTGGGGGHTHTISGTGSTHTHSATTASDGAHTHTVTPPFYALCYIIRK